MFVSALVTDVHWLLLGVLVAVAVTAVLSLSGHVSLALIHDALPILLTLSWVVLIVAVLEGAWILVGCAAVVCVYHLAIVLPRTRAEHIPRWAHHAPTLDLVVANVYVHNKTPGDLARTVLAANADVIVFAEWNPTFAAEFNAAGGRDAYPHRVCDENDHSEYAVCIASRLQLGEGSKIDHIGPLKVATSELTCGDHELKVVGLNPTAVVGAGGYQRWKAEIEALIAAVPTLGRPLVLAGDFNTTQFRPEFRRLLKTGLTDAHDSLGKGLSRSWKLAATGPLAAPGTVARLDHALLSDGVRAISATDLESCGSDHVPFRLTLAVRQGDDHHELRGRRSSTPAPAPAS